MGPYVASQTIKEMVRKRIHVVGARCLVLGLAFKENCPDLRNTRIVDFVHELKDFGVHVDVSDPWVVPDDAKREYDIDLVKSPEQNAYDAIIVAVAHDEYKKLGASGIHAFGRDPHVLFDLKYVLPVEDSDLRL
jgi:UDP-N-acetyl-D-galactosamine dehydrogenase